MRFLSSLFLVFIFISNSLIAQDRKIYTVQQGETLYGISKTLTVSVAELQSWNNLSDNTLSIGDTLFYYISTTPQTQPLEEQAPSLVAISKPQENIFYIVKSGDNLTVIARRHNMGLAELKKLNNLTSDILRIGQQLSVKKVKDSFAPSVSQFSKESSPQGTFAVYTLGANESMASILSKFEMAEKELQELNPEVNIASLDRGQKITVLLPPSRVFKNPYSNNASLQDLGSVGVDYYKENEFGNSTTSGELYNPNELTAAHSNIALGSILFIENTETSSGVYVRVNDRITGSGLKLSYKAFRILRLENSVNPTVTIYTDS